MRLLQPVTIFLVAFMLAACDGGISVNAEVVDATNNPIPNANATMHSSQSGREYSSVTSEHGCLSIGGTATPGKYEYQLAIFAPGYKRLELPVQTLEHYNFHVVLERESSARTSRASPATEPRCGAL